MGKQVHKFSAYSLVNPFLIFYLIKLILPTLRAKTPDSSIYFMVEGF